MTITHGYATLAEFQEWNEIQTVTLHTAEAERAIEAASRWIDSECERHFWQETAVARVFDACDRWYLDFGAYNDLAAITSLRTDQGGDGTWETTWAASDYQLLPLRPAAAPEPRPYTAIRSTGTRSFPRPFAGSRIGRIQVTGTWGWPAVPAPVTQACLIQASRVYKRRVSPEGVTGFGSEFGPVRLSARPDPDAVALIAPYRYHGVLVG